MSAITIGLDIAKSVFQVHGEDASGKMVFQKRLRRTQLEPFFAKLAPAARESAACPVGPRSPTARCFGRSQFSSGWPEQVSLLSTVSLKASVRTS